MTKEKVQPEHELWLFALKQCGLTVEELQPKPLQYFKDQGLPDHIAEVHWKHHDKTRIAKQEALIHATQEIAAARAELCQRRSTHVRAQHANQHLQTAIQKHAAQLRKQIQRHNNKVELDEKRKKYEEHRRQQVQKERIQQVADWGNHQELMKQRAAEHEEYLAKMHKRQEIDKDNAEEKVNEKMRKVNEAQNRKKQQLEQQSDDLQFTAFMKKGIVDQNRKKIKQRKTMDRKITDHEEYLRQQHWELHTRMFEGLLRSKATYDEQHAQAVKQRREKMEEQRRKETQASIRTKNAQWDSMNRQKQEDAQVLISNVDARVNTVKEQREKIEEQTFRKQEIMRMREEERFMKYLQNRSIQQEAKREAVSLRNWDKCRASNRVQNLKEFQLAQRALKWTLEDEDRIRNEHRIQQVQRKLQDDVVKLELESKKIKESNKLMQVPTLGAAWKQVDANTATQALHEKKHRAEEEGALLYLLGAMETAPHPPEKKKMSPTAPRRKPGQEEQAVDLSDLPGGELGTSVHMHSIETSSEEEEGQGEGSLPSSITNTV